MKEAKVLSPEELRAALTPEEVDDMVSSLELHKQRWGVRIRGTLYMLPEYVTKAEAVELIHRAAMLHRTKHN